MRWGDKEDMKSYKGYTLIEVIVAVAIFAILVTPIVLLIQQSLKINVSAQKNLDVAQVINEAVEDIVYQNIVGTGTMNVRGYRIEYNIDDTYKTGDIQNISNNQIDFRIKLDSTGRLVIEDVRTLVNFTRTVSTSNYDKLLIKIKYDSSVKQATYTFIFNNSTMGTFICGNVTDPARLGAEFVSSSLTNYLYVVLDGVYDVSNKLSQSLFNLWLTNVGNNIKIVATTPFIEYDNSARASSLSATEKVKKIDLKVYDNLNNLIKEYTTYYSYRVK